MMEVNINFYLIKESEEREKARQKFASIFINRFYQCLSSLYVQTQNEEEGTAFDKLLWQIFDTSFIPHLLAREENYIAPVIIGWGDDYRKLSPPYILNLTAKPLVLEYFPKKIIEIVSLNANCETSYIEKNYGYYQKENFKLNIYDLRDKY